MPDPTNQDLYPLGSPEDCRICDQLRTTNWMAGVMVTVLRQYFGSPDRITLEKNTLVWKPDVTGSQVQIDVVDNLKFEEGNKYPKILVDIEDQKLPQNVIGDTSGYQPDGTIEFNNQLESAYSIECWGQKKLEASAIADEVRYFLQAYRHVIAQKYLMDKLRVVHLLKPVKYQKFDDYWLARLIVEFKLQENWGTKKESLEVSDFFVKVKAS